MGIAAHLHRRLELASGMLESARRDFTPAAAPAGRVLDTVVESFAHGYNTALAGDFDAATLPPELRGFGYEGAAMSLTLLDLLTLSRGRRVRGLLSGEGERYVHLIHVGAGWAFARLRLRPWTGIRRGSGLAPAHLRWLAWDGWGFHRAFFAPGPVFEDRRPGPAGVRQLCDQGAGRALWFYAGADPDRIRDVISSFPDARRPDLWAGIGLAAAYTGARSPDVLAALAEDAADHRDHLAQGAAFAATAHLRAAYRPATGVEVLTGVAPETAARWTDQALARVSGGPDTAAAYEGWRAGVRRAWALEGLTVS